jgi:predicted O-methyltransferase YrrM
MELTWHTDDRFAVDGIEFVCFHGQSTSGPFLIQKPRRLVEATVDLIHTSQAGRIVELGIASGGSTALLGLTHPHKLVAIEKDETPVDALTDLVASRSLSVRPYFGVDQGDRERLAAIVAEEFGATPLDLVIDDASHRLAETRASFETLFPRLRPGGIYVIEDWNWQLRFTYGLAHPPPTPRTEPPEGAKRWSEYWRQNARPTPLETLALELVLVRACSNQVVTELRIDESWVVVTRGPAELDTATFRLSDHFVDPHDLIESS